MKDLLHRISWPWVIVAIFAGLAAVTLVQSLTAEPTTQPKVRDFDATQRTAVARNGEGVDERMPLPQDVDVSANGVVEPRGKELALALQAPGIIEEVFAQEGQKVEAGAPLLRLESALLKAQLQAAQAELAASEAQFERARRGSRPAEIQDARAQAKAVAAQLERSQRELERRQQLLAEKVIAQDEFDRARYAHAQLQSELEAAQARLRLRTEGSRAEDIAEARAMRDAAKARLELAEQELNRHTLDAPIAGEILKLNLRPGEYYQPGSQALVVMGDTRELHVRLDIDERDVGKVRLGQKARVQALSFPGEMFQGEVLEIGRRMGPKNVSTRDPGERQDTRVLEVVVALENPGRLVPGLRVRGFLGP